MDLQASGMLISSTTNNCQKINNPEQCRHIDFSGCDIRDKNFNSGIFEESIFNGASFLNTKDNNSNFKHVEFAEAFFSECTFTGSNLDHSDFVLAVFNSVIFENCSFENGEWRESKFTNCRFINCEFSNTTINLCTFYNCCFDIQSSSSFVGISKKYNLFIECDFYISEKNITFLENNFGIKSKVEYKNIDWHENINILYSASLLEYESRLVNTKFLEIIVECFIILLSSNTKSYQSTLRYIANIVKYFAEQRLTIFQLSYLIAQLTVAIRHSANQIILLELIQLLTLLNQTLLHLREDKICRIRHYLGAFNYQREHVKFEVIFEHSYNETQVKELFRALAIFANIDEDQIVIEDIKYGSTFVKGFSKKVFEFTGVLTALTFALQNVEVTFDAVLHTYVHISEKVGQVAKNETNSTKELSILDENKNTELRQFQGKVNEMLKQNKTISEFDGFGKIIIS